MERKNYHKKNVSSVAITARTKKTSSEKDKSKEKSNNKLLESKIKRKMSFESPSRKDSTSTAETVYHNLSLLNYMIYKQKHKKPICSVSLAKDGFVMKEILGKGGFGKVFKVEYKKSKTIYAMKEMSKTVIITKKSIQSVLNERELLAELKHPYIVNMVYAFQDRLNLYLIMDYMPGGDLRYQIGKFERFPEHIVKFFVCCILLALQYLHTNSIIHRDIKPENLIFDSKGYLRLTDLGVARVHSKDNYKDTSGTPGYMAPEVINRQNHSFEVDFFALGVIAYECMLGKRPYRGYNRQQIREQILLYEASIKVHQLPPNWSPQSAEFINQLLKRKPTQRLGHNGIDQVLHHPWLSDIDWNKMIQKKYPSPFMPNLDNRNYDTVSESDYDNDTLEKMAENGLLLRKKSVQDLFAGYEYEEVKLQ